MVGLLYGDIYGDDGASVGWSAEGIDKLRKGIELIRRFFERNPQHAPYVNNYRVYRTTFDRPGNDQDMVWLEGELDGKLSVRKEVRTRDCWESKLFAGGNAVSDM